MEETKERCYERYLKQGNDYVPIGETKDILPQGFYKPVYDSYHEKAYLTKKEVIMPTLYLLPNEIQTNILDDIQTFWKSEERYRQFGSVYKRNILLYSLPGNGKTSLINIIANQLINDYNGVVIFIDSVKDLQSYQIVMERFRSVEPNRKVITIIEDFERLAKNDELTALILQTLDGNGQFDNVVTIATTNHPEILEKRFTCRPSRFNLVIEFKKPNAIIRQAYIERKLSSGGIDINDKKVRQDISRYVLKTEGYTFDFVKEVIQSIYIDGISEEATFNRLEELIKKNGKIKVTEDGGNAIGFNEDDLYCDLPSYDIDSDYGDSCHPSLDRCTQNMPKKIRLKGFSDD